MADGQSAVAAEVQAHRELEKAVVQIVGTSLERVFGVQQALLGELVALEALEEVHVLLALARSADARAQCRPELAQLAVAAQQLPASRARGQLQHVEPLAVAREPQLGHRHAQRRQVQRAAADAGMSHHGLSTVERVTRLHHDERRGRGHLEFCLA